MPPRRKSAAPAAQPKKAFPPELEEFRKDGRMIMGTDPSLVVQRIPTGIAVLDGILNGGIPRRRMTILTGTYSAGKTFCLQLIMRRAVDQGLSVVYVDTEQTFDPEWWKQVGLPLDKIHVSQPTTGEDAAEVMVGASRAGVDIVALDSLAALYPKKMVEEEDFEKNFMGYRARLINRLVETLISVKSQSAIVCTNQVRDNFSSMPGLPDMPGGRGLKHYTSLILRLSREGWIEDRGKRVGFNIRVVCAKSKVGTPFGECLLPFRFRGDIDMSSLLLDRALEHGLATQKGPWFYLTIAGEEHRVQGRNSIVDLLRERKDLADALEGAMRA